MLMSMTMPLEAKAAGTGVKYTSGLSFLKKNLWVKADPSRGMPQ